MRRIAGALALMLVGGLVGCSGPSGEPPRAAPSSSENQINSQPRENLQDGGRLTWPLGGYPPNFNYYQLDGTLADNAYVINAMMPGTFFTDAAGTPRYNRDLLDGEPVLRREPRQVVTYTINPRARWYDGKRITWEDFHWQWRASNGSDKAYAISSSNGYDQIASVEKGRDDLEVVVTYQDRYADWTALFNPIYPASTNRDPVVFNEGWKAQPINTAGPFRFHSANRTTKTITLVRNEKWWGRPARLDTIVFRVIELNAQVDALANGEIDLLDIGPDVNTYRRAKGLAEVEIRVAGGPNFRHVTFNGTAPHLRDVTVRRAVAMAINREAIGRAMLGPMNIDIKPLNNHIFMTNQEGYLDNAGDIGRYDPEQARRLLDQAGWRSDGTARRRDGALLELSMVIPAGVATGKQEAELIQSMLAQVGVTVRITAVPTTDFFDKYITPGQFDLTVFSWLGTAYPVSSARSIYKNPVQDTNGQLAIQQNFARIGSAEIDQLFDQATAELDRPKAIALANQIDKLIWQQVHSLTSYQRPDQWACKRGLANFGAFGFASALYEDIGWIRR